VKQSGRPWTLSVEPPRDFADWLRETAGPICDGHTLGLLLHPTAEPIDDLAERVRAATRVVLLVGPEGGWAEGEVADAAAAGYRPWRMAENVLRLETAAAAGVAILRYLAPSTANPPAA
jgi:16S rRNA (uracil1498-N3)-methyltransferase